ncbi:HD-GYP domain-containing protein [Selenomonas sp. TAMA-11512]|uniref:HD-GYP domain-containing protein n=1 Tax=Selenomonas sp. TAMA-11512 TaxID=3095337 RepID=UPI00308C18F9|nr:HD-GYP domain-containing protein [Selenomonas sp. TAMA-11512]
MLKRTPVGDLLEGMVLGRPIYKEDMSTLLSDGTALTSDHIDAIRAIGMPAVYVIVEDDVDTASVSDEAAKHPAGEANVAHTASIDYDAKAIPEKTQILDQGFVKEYNDCLDKLEIVYEQAKSGLIDPVMAEQLASAVMRLSKGAKAVSHIHNLEVKGDYILHHSLHVAILAGLMGKWLRMSKRRQREFIIAALFMDLGNIRLSPTLLNKSGRLTPEERKLMQRHVELGYEIVRASALGENEDIANAVLQHHERNDGTGYPNGISKEQISEFARILALLDMYDAMGSNRVYANKKSPFEVFDIMSNDITNGKLDTDFGFQFIRRVCHSLHGNWVQLSNGEKAKIVYMDESRLFSLPVVQTMEGEFIDLNRQADIKINHLLTSTELG